MDTGRPKARTGLENSLAAERPWRRVGTVLCVFIAVMFVAGLAWLEPRKHPFAFMAYWAIIMVLVLWLCALAIRDILFTRKLIAQWAAHRDTEVAKQRSVDEDRTQP